jgi:hypothetical protein
MNGQHAEKTLQVILPVNLALRPMIRLGSHLIFEVIVRGQNVKECELVIESDANIFTDAYQRIPLESVQDLDQPVVVGIEPIAITEKPVYVSIKAVSSGGITQTAGFFVQVVSSEAQEN